MVNFFYPRKENREKLEGLFSLENDKGWPSVRTSPRSVLVLVSSFSPTAGCFANHETMARSIGVSKKTIDRSVNYLVQTGFLVVGNNGGKKAYFLGEGSRLSPTMSRMPRKIKKGGEPMTSSPKPPVQVVPPILPKSVNPPRPEPVQAVAPIVQADKLQPASDLNWSEPLLPEEKKRTKRQTKSQRMMEAINKIGRGHIANPLGVTDNRPRRLCPKLARDVPLEQISSVPQLYKFLVKAYSEVFGEASIEDMMPQDKGAVASQFSLLSQKFVDHCSYEPKKSDLAEYFKWFLDPKRVQAIIKSAEKHKGRKDDKVTWNQMTGALYVKRFYDEVIAKRLDVVPSSTAPSAESTSSKVKKMYDRLSMAESNPSGLMISMVPIGYVISAQYLHDERGMSKDEAKKALLGLMRRFVSGASDKAAAIRYLRKMEGFTKEKMPSCDARCVWYDWVPLASLVDQVESEESRHEPEEGLSPDGGGQNPVKPDSGQVQPDIRRDVGGEEGHISPVQHH